MANSVLHTPSRHTFSCDGTQRLFPIPSYIISQDYVRIEIDGVLQSDRKKWDIVNNSLVFIEAPSNGSILDVQVASDSESLGELGMISNVDIVAQNITDVSAVGSNIDDVINVSNNINTVTEGFVEIKTVADNISSVNTNASNIDDIVTVAGINNNVVDVSEIKTEVITVTGIKDNVTTVSNIESSVVSVANNETNINEVASIKTEVTTVAGIKDEIVLIKDNLEDVQNASENAINAKLDSYKAEAHKLTANSYAVEPEDTFVKIYTSNGDGTFTATDTTDYSALHWERKASTLVTEGIIDDTTPAVDRTYSSIKVQGAFDNIEQDIEDLTTTIDNINANINDIENSVADIYKEIPTGFPNRVDSKISFDEVSRIFTIEPTVDKYSFYVEGVEFEKDVTSNVTIDDIDGLWFIYFNSNGELQKSQTNFFNIPNSAYVAYIYWNSTQQKAVIFGDERHGIQMDRATHAYLHNFEGARYRNGLVIGNYTLVGTGNSDVDAQFSITGGSIQDEDIIHNIVHSNTPTNDYEQYLTPHVKAPIQYRNGINGEWFTTDTNDFVIKMNSGVPQYNQKTTGWDLANVPNNNYYAIWILATNNKKEPIISIVGQRVDTTLEDAIANNKFSDLDFGNTALLEFKQLYRLIYQYNSSFTNQVKSALRSIVDVRGTTVRQISSTTSVSHNETTGRSEENCHPISSITGLQTELNNKLAINEKAQSASIADTATKLETARTITISGAVTGSGVFDGSENIDIATELNSIPNNGSIGSYALAKNMSSTLEIPFGTIMAGSYLRPSASNSSTIYSSTALNGTWKCMGYNNTSANIITLWLRIA